LRWACEVGSAVVAVPALAGSYLLVASSHGLVYRTRADTGEVQASYDLAKYTRTRPWLLSSLTLEGGRVWFGAGLDDFVGGMVPRLYCLKEDLGRPDPFPELVERTANPSGTTSVAGQTNAWNHELPCADLNTDAGLKELKELRNLRELDVFNTKVTAVGTRELKTALPELDITR
jgi:hypothetical protein